MKKLTIENARKRISYLPERSCTTVFEMLGKDAGDWNGENLETVMNDGSVRIRKICEAKDVHLLDMYLVEKSPAGEVDVSGFPDAVLNLICSGLFDWRSDGKRIVDLIPYAGPFGEDFVIRIIRVKNPDRWFVGLGKFPENADERLFSDLSGIPKTGFGFWTEVSEEEIPKTVGKMTATPEAIRTWD